MFPTANSQVYRNEEGEVLGWDSYDADRDAPYDPDDYLSHWDDEEDEEEDG